MSFKIRGMIMALILAAASNIALAGGETFDAWTRNYNGA